MSELIEILKKRAAGCEVVVTDRYAPKELIELADLVTEMREVKHYYREGIDAREGIEHEYTGENQNGTDIVRCRPLGNRPPTPQEAAACIPWLHRQLELVNPRIVILLGATALRNMAGPDYRITRVRGNWIQQGNRLMMPVYHPSPLALVCVRPNRSGKYRVA